MPDSAESSKDGGFRAAVTELAPVAWRVMRRCGVPDADADDAMQRLLVQIARHWGRLQRLAPAELRGYVCCAAAGVARTTARERFRVEAKVSHADEPQPEAGPHAALERKEAIELLDRILQRMDEERRTVFVLYEIEGLSAPDIARHLGIPVGTVASRLRKAREEFERGIARVREGGAS